jgi:hypothetical protein
MVGRQFTWANSLPEPTFEKLDRVLMDANWESKFPMVFVRAPLERIEGFSNHAPILLTTGTPKPTSKHRFKFELGWLVGYNVKVFTTWLRIFGKDLLLLILQYKDGIQNYGLYVVI